MAYAKARINAVKLIEYRLEKRLDTNDVDTRYFKDRFVWIIDKFKDEYFVNGKQVDVQKFMDRTFDLLSILINEGKVKNISRFIYALGISMCEVAPKLDLKIKVTPNFFIDHFHMAVMERFRYQRLFIRKHLNFFVKALYNVGFSVIEAIFAVELALVWAETVTKYDWSLEQFLEDLIDEMEMQCVLTSKLYNREMFYPRGYRHKNK